MICLFLFAEGQGDEEKRKGHFYSIVVNSCTLPALDEIMSEGKRSSSIFESSECFEVRMYQGTSGGPSCCDSAVVHCNSRLPFSLTRTLACRVSAGQE